MYDIVDYLDIGYGGSYHTNYESIVQSFGYNVLMDEYLGSYQGDVVFVLYDPLFRQWGFFVTGYGSCSGCDILEAMEANNDPLQEYQNLQREWHNKISWYNSPGELYEDVVRKEGDWYYYEDGYEEFVEKFKEVYVDGSDA